MSLQIGDLIPLQGLTKEDKQKLIEIVNKAEVNQSTIKNNISNALNNKIGSNLTGSSSWMDIQNAISNMPNKRWKVGTSIVSEDKLHATGLEFKPKTIIWYDNLNKNYGFFHDELSYYIAKMSMATGSQTAEGYDIKDAYTTYGSFDITIYLKNGVAYNWIAIE